MSAADEAARLREQADALDEEAQLEKAAAEAKAKYRKNQNDSTKNAHREASQALAEHRAARRGEALGVGGDAFVDNGQVEGSEG